MKKKILVVLIIILFSIMNVCIYKLYVKNIKMQNEIDELQRKISNKVENEIIISEETKKLSDQTKEIVNRDEKLSTTEEIEGSEQEEKNITDNEALETDAIVDQENISYDGDHTGEGLSLLGKYQGLTYYNQADSRWANIMYSSINNKAQTMKTSACGPTTAAMIISSAKGAILPTTMARLSVDNRYRTANSGTAWSFYSFVADYFKFSEFYSINSFDKAMEYLKQKNNSGTSKYYIACSVGSGLFTTGGHYIMLVSNSNRIIRVYDSYLYKGKFNTASRKNANVTVNGNSEYLTEENFKRYSNYKHFWVFSNDEGNLENNNSDNNKTYKMYVNTKSKNLNVRTEPNGTIVSSLTKGTEVTVIETIGDWSKIGTNEWVSSNYLTNNYVSKAKDYVEGQYNKYSIGKYKVITNINVRYGPSTRYLRKNYRQLSENARLQNRRLGGQYNGYRKGVICTVIKINGNWGLTKSGWICLNYCKKIS